jgi:hypothetical protein
MIPTPHASFQGTLPTDAEFDHPPGASLARKLEARLRDRFGSVSAFDNWRDCGWLLALDLGGKPLEVYFAPFDGNDRWLLAVAVARQPGLVARLFGRKPVECTQELRSIAREVHAVLQDTAGVSGIAWLSGGPPGSVPTVSTPDELLWR